MIRSSSLKISIMPMLVMAGLLVCGCQQKSNLPVPAQIDHAVQESADAIGFTGNVLVLHKGEVLYRHSFGAADRAAGRPNNDQTPFMVASLSKPFTAVLVMQLVEDGRLKLDDRLDGIFPELAGKPVGAVTVAQLLSHTSGLEEVTEQHLTRPLVPADLAAARLTSKPGDFAYSTAGYVVLKLVIEKVSGQDYATRLKEKILTPTGMIDTGLMRRGLTVPGLAQGYAVSGTAPAVMTVPVEIFDGAGSLYTTADDLARFDKALSGNVILSAGAQRLMYARHTPQGSTAWGYGWALADQNGRLYPWHKGDITGYTAVMVRQIHRDELIVILSNQEKADLTPMRQKILRILKVAEDEN